METFENRLAITRRSLMAGAVAAAMAGAGGALAAGPARPMLTMHRNAGCGCCTKWAEIARKAGFRVSIVDSPDLLAVKRKHGVPDRLASCHTTLAGPYVVEGHVPIDAVARLLTQKPKIKGIAVPGMPLGSPGMETPDGRSEQFTVFAFTADGKVRPFA